MIKKLVHYSLIAFLIGLMSIFIISLLTFEGFLFILSIVGVGVFIVFLYSIALSFFDNV